MWPYPAWPTATVVRATGWAEFSRGRRGPFGLRLTSMPVR
jgi:hypothetical protein